MRSHLQSKSNLHFNGAILELAPDLGSKNETDQKICEDRLTSSVQQNEIYPPDK